LKLIKHLRVNFEYHLSICLLGRVSWFLVIKTWSPYNRASLGCGGTGASCPGCPSHKSPSTARYYPINMGQHF